MRRTQITIVKDLVVCIIIEKVHHCIEKVLQNMIIEITDFVEITKTTIHILMTSRERKDILHDEITKDLDHLYVPPDRKI